MMYVLGFDLSTTSAGYAAIDADTGRAMMHGAVVPDKGLEVFDRCRAIVNELDAWVPQEHLIADAAVEKPFARNGDVTGKLWSLVGAVRLMILPRESAMFTPTEVKLHGTGNGAASKEEMILAAEDHFGVHCHSDDEADALWIADLCRARLDRAIAG